MAGCSDGGASWVVTTVLVCPEEDDGCDCPEVAGG